MFCAYCKCVLLTTQCAFLLVTCTTESGLAVAEGWAPRQFILHASLSSVAPGFNSLADPVCRGYTLTRVTHGLDRDLVPHYMHAYLWVWGLAQVAPMMPGGCPGM